VPEESISGLLSTITPPLYKLHIYQHVLVGMPNAARWRSILRLPKTQISDLITPTFVYALLLLADKDCYGL